MDKYHALIILIKNSFLLSEKAKINLLKKVPQLSLKEVEELGSFLVYERDFFEKNQKAIEKNLTLLIQDLNK
jgi:hypothetical protein